MTQEDHTIPPEHALIALGSNLPVAELSPRDVLAHAIARLSQETGQTPRVSRFYRTPAFPKGAGPDFVNAALSLTWADTAQALLDLLHQIEAAFGRTRDTRWGARGLDLDLLALGDQILPDARIWAQWAGLAPDAAARRAPDRLILPHPRMAERGFVLIPLCDIAADWVHPVLGQSLSELADALPISDRVEIHPI